MEVITLTNIYLILVVTIFSIILILYFVARNNMRRQSRGMNEQACYKLMSDLSNHFTGNMSKSSRFFFNQPSFTGSLSGHNIKITLWRSELIGPPLSKLFLSCHIISKNKLKILMYRANPGTVLFVKRIHIEGNELDKLYVYSNKPDEAKRYLNDILRRTTVKQIVESGCEPPIITRNTITTVVDITQHKLDPEDIKAILIKLISLQ